jgi:NADPH:quinone reductase-like Zn-dependent oxidoreductase
MKAICVTPERKLELRDVPTPADPPAQHVLVDVDSAAINHGDKTFLARPAAAGLLAPAGRFDVWGASCAGTIVAAGAGVPAEVVGKPVAVYRSLRRSPDLIGLWCERAQVPFADCVLLPERVNTRDYCGSLVNAMTAYAFLREIAEDGHKGVVATAGGSATGRALAALARRAGVAVVFATRSARSAEELRALGVGPAVLADGAGFEAEFEALAAEAQATAVFVGVGGAFLGRLLPRLPANAAIYFYGFLDGAAPLAFPTALFMAKNFTMRRFSNFESPTVRDSGQLALALAELGPMMGDPLFRTRIGKTFRLEEVEAAMSYEAVPGAKAVLLP